MKRKYLSLLLAFIMLALTFTGCSSKNSSVKPTEGTKAGTEAQTTTIEAASIETTAEVITTAEETEAQTTAEKTEAPTTEAPTTEAQTTAVETTASTKLDKNGSYTSKEDVALYIHTYGKLPSNYISKYDAEDLGWDSSAGNLWDVAPGKSIGGNKFGNYEGLLPAKDGRKYYECDIDFTGGYRNAKRIIYSNDGLIYYTEDHYKTFELLYEGK